MNANDPGSVRIEPASAAAACVVWLHGLGADGHDLIGLADQWRALLPGAAFISPDAPQPCDMAPMGRQWFSLQALTPAALLAGVRGAAPALDGFLDEQLARFGLGPDRLALVGFSQGTMMALYVVPRRPDEIAALVGYSGRLIGADELKRETKSRPPVRLIHGEHDEMVPASSMESAAKALAAAGFSVETHLRPGLGHGIDPEGIAIAGHFIAEQFAKRQ